eukprot:3483302-Prorocentrum_lima.AAC.1
MYIPTQLSCYDWGDARETPRSGVDNLHGDKLMWHPTARPAYSEEAGVGWQPSVLLLQLPMPT